MPAIKTRTLDRFNDGRPLRVVRVDETRLGVVDESTRRVWIEHDVASSRMNLDALVPVSLPTMPETYGQWVKKSVGGVSSTMRRIGVLRAKPKHTGAVVLFALRQPSPDACACALSDVRGVSVGDTETDDTYGDMTEVVVHSAEDLAHVAARLARAGCEIHLEDASVDAQRSLGIERLDRIHANVVHDHEIEEGDDVTGGLYGLRRGGENWRFPWMPTEWKRVPITWDHLVENVIDQPLETIPQPLRQHVARVLLDRGEGDDWTSWTRAAPPTVDEEGGAGFRVVVRDGTLASQLAHGTVSDELVRRTLDLEDPRVRARRVVAIDGDGVWRKPIDKRAGIARHIPSKRLVSSALDRRQSIQLIEAFYVLGVEQVDDPETAHALELVMYRYMLERGYTARWLGKYDQRALHVGNGHTFRSFRRMSQYAPDRLPANVINKLCDRDGRLRSRGSKGTRSRFKREGVRRYVPKRRLGRTEEDEAQMVDTC